MRSFKCAIHNAEFAYPETQSSEFYCDCPFCLQEELKTVRKELAEVKEQRDALVKAIRIRKTFYEK